MISYSETLITSLKLFEELKCTSCNKIPPEPYTTGVCDHLMCKHCIFQSNNCPKCSISFKFKDILEIDAIRDMVKSVTEMLALMQNTDQILEKCEAVTVLNRSGTSERESKKMKIENEMHEDFLIKSDLSTEIKPNFEIENDKPEYIIINENSNDDDFQTVLENNLCSKTKLKPERPKNLALRETSREKSVDRNLSKNQNENTIEIIDEDSACSETGDNEMEILAFENNFEQDNISSKAIALKNVNEQDALDLFRSFCDKSNNHNNDDDEVVELKHEHSNVLNHKNPINTELSNIKYVSGDASIYETKNVAIISDKKNSIENVAPTDEKYENHEDFELPIINLSISENQIEFNNNDVEKTGHHINVNHESMLNETYLMQNETMQTNELPITGGETPNTRRSNTKRGCNKQSKTVIFKPEICKTNNVKSETATLQDEPSRIPSEAEKLPIKPRGRGRKPKNEPLEMELQPTQTQFDGKKKLKRNDKGETQLHLAAIDGDYETCKNLLEQNNMDPNLTDNAGWTALHEACGNGNIEIVRLLVDNNANINFKGFKDSTPLHEAILNNHLNCAKILLEKCCDVTIRNCHGFLAKDFLKNCKNGHTLTKLFEKLELNNPCTQKPELPEILPTYQNKTRGKRGNTQKPKTVTIYSTGMCEEEKIKLIEVSKKLNFKFVREMSTNVTHVVFKDSQNNKTCQRTINFMKAVLIGSWIVSVKWIEDSLIAGHLLEENTYEALGSHKAPTSHSPFNGRMNACYENPNLFEDFFFFLYGDFKIFEKNDLIQLIKVGGGTVLRREPKLERLDELMTKVPFHADKTTHLKCTHFIIYDATKPREIIRNPYLNTLNVNFIFNCIDEFVVKVDENTR